MSNCKTVFCIKLQPYLHLISVLLSQPVKKIIIIYSLTLKPYQNYFSLFLIQKEKHCQKYYFTLFLDPKS